MGILKKDINTTKKIVDNLRGLSLDIINNANSGHPGIALGAAPIMYTLYAKHLKFNKNEDKWINRDRFVLSAGHGSALLYATLFMAGFNLSLDDLKAFRSFGSITPGHPECDVTPGVDVSTGPLGQGIATAVGMSIAEAYLGNQFGKNIIDYYTYVLCGDGDLMEGISYEAVSLAGKLGLNKLIVLYDSNDITLDGELSNSSQENTKMRFEANNWNVLVVNDGEDCDAIDEAITKAKESDRPTLIEIKTIIGKHSKYQGTSKVHGAPLDGDDLAIVKEKLGLRDIPFSISDEAITTFREEVEERNSKTFEKWTIEYEKLSSGVKDDLDMLINYKEPLRIKNIYYQIPDDLKESTRVTSGKIINSIANNFKFFIGGSADTASSTYGIISGFDNFSSKTPSGRNINFGIREHAMGAIINGIALAGVTPFASTFLAFSDYMKPAIRMSTLMNLPVIYVFTHDSITVGQDGPSHQPIEQLIALRSIPNLDVYRPVDSNETLGAYKTILENRRPSAIILGRNKVNIQSDTSVNDVKMGAYVLHEEHSKLQAVIISTGEEMEIALDVCRTLSERGFGIRLVSMPSIEVYERQDKKYREQIIPKNIPVFVIELSSSYSWYKYAKNEEHLFTIDEFGTSGDKDDVLRKFGFEKEEIINKIEKLLK